MHITNIRHSSQISPEFKVGYPFGASEYIFIHFWNSVKLSIDGVEHITKPHACILFEPGTPQDFNSDEGFTHDWIHITGNVRKVFEKYNLKTNTIIYPTENIFITKIIKKLEYDFFAQPEFYKDFINIKIEELFLLISRSVNAEINIPIKKEFEQKVYEFRNILLTEINKDWKVSDMAAEVYLSSSRFFLIYKSLFGISPIQDLIRARIEKSKTLLVSENRSILEISEMVGYQNVSHFIRQFKEIVGMTPKAYRNQQNRMIH